jgi:hypothetical protein
MGHEDPRKIAVALVVLALALGSVGFQVYRRMHPSPTPVAAPVTAATAGITMEQPFVAAAPGGVPVPVTDVARVLERNPFLRPAGRGPKVATDGARPAPPSANGLELTGIRTGSRPMTIIDDRTLRVGDSVRGWTVRSIERDRVTLENSHGRTLHLDLR